MYVTIDVLVCQPGNRSVHTSGPNVYFLNSAFPKGHLAKEKGWFSHPFQGASNAAMHQSQIYCQLQLEGFKIKSQAII